VIPHKNKNRSSDRTPVVVADAEPGVASSALPRHRCRHCRRGQRSDVPARVFHLIEEPSGFRQTATSARHGEIALGDQIVLLARQQLVKRVRFRRVHLGRDDAEVAQVVRATAPAPAPCANPHSPRRDERR
jgi:hypothetical protein